MTNLKLSALILSLLITTPTLAREATESEKYVLHFMISAGLGYAAENILHNRYKTPSTRIITASAIAMIPGLAKEIYDELEDDSTYFSEMDLLADAAGAFLGASTAHYFNQKGSITLSHTEGSTLVGFRYRD